MSPWKDGFIYGGYDVENAQVVELYFDILQSAEYFYKKYKDTEAMAFLEVY